MKIVATIRSDLFLVEVTDDELAKVMGYRGSYHLKDKAALRPGATISVSAMFDSLEYERGRRDELSAAAKKLRTEADKIDKINASLDCPLAREVSPS